MKKKVEIEAWALRIVDQVARSEVPEDASVELKADWPEAAKAARRIAGHANAARGAEIMWIIGLNEKQGVTTRSAVELADWWAQVSARFDEVVPAMLDVIVPVGDEQTVVALCFDTDRAPYVVKSGTNPEREVPWREGTSVRAARRSDLVRVLVATQGMPAVQIVDAALHAYTANNPDAAQLPAGSLRWRFEATLYFTAAQGAYVVFPFRLLGIELQPDGIKTSWTAEQIDLTASKPERFPRYSDKTPRVQTVHNGVDQLILEGHGYAWMYAHGVLPGINGVPPVVAVVNRVDAIVTLHGVELPGPVVASSGLVSADPSTSNWGSGIVSYWRTESDSG
jgi:hypothetical protein